MHGAARTRGGHGHPLPGREQAIGDDSLVDLLLERGEEAALAQLHVPHHGRLAFRSTMSLERS